MQRLIVLNLRYSDSMYSVMGNTTICVKNSQGLRCLESRETLQSEKTSLESQKIQLQSENNQLHLVKKEFRKVVAVTAEYKDIFSDIRTLTAGIPC